VTKYLGDGLMALFGLALSLSWIWGAKAAAGKRPASGRGRSLRGVLWSDFGRRDEFTDLAWRYRKMALCSSLVALVALLGWWLTFL